MSGETDGSGAPPTSEPRAGERSELDPRDREFLDWLIEITWADMLARLRTPPSNDNR